MIEFNVEDYIGEIATMAWNLGFETTVIENNDLIIEDNRGDPFAPRITAKFILNGDDEFWFNPEMTFPRSKLTFEDGSSYSFESITRRWYDASSIAERLLEASWYIEEEEE